MSIIQMRKQLLKWNPHWKKDTVAKWSDKQIAAIYIKELDKRSKHSQENVKQLSFF